MLHKCNHLLIEPILLKKTIISYLVSGQVQINFRPNHDAYIMCYFFAENLACTHINVLSPYG